MFAVNERVVADGKAGVVQGVSTFGELWPDVIRHQESCKRPRKTPADPNEQIAAVVFDGEERPRNVPSNKLTKEV